MNPNIIGLLRHQLRSERDNALRVTIAKSVNILHTQPALKARDVPKPEMYNPVDAQPGHEIIVKQDICYGSNHEK